MRYVLWAGSSHLPNQPMHSSSLARVCSGWHLDPTLQTKGRLQHPNGLSWLKKASWFHMCLIPTPCYLRRATAHTIPFANKQPIKNTFSAQKVSGKQYGVTDGINPGGINPGQSGKDLSCKNINTSYLKGSIPLISRIRLGLHFPFWG